MLGSFSEQAIEWLRTWGALTPASGLMLAAMFVVASFVFVPRTFLYLGVGAVFGLPVIPIVLPATTVGSVLAFLAARYLFANSLRSRLDRYPRLKATAEAIDSESWRVVALLRLASPLPNAFQNYAFGLTRIGFWPYAIATFVFTIPQTVLYVYLGAAGRSALLDDSSSPLRTALTALGALCLAITVFLIWRKARAALQSLQQV